MTDVLHITDDVRTGGVMTNIRNMKSFDAQLGVTQRFSQVNPDSVSNAQRFKADAIVVHFSLAWRKLPYLLALRALNSKSLLVLQEHHYSPEHFEIEQYKLKRFEKLARSSFRLFDRVLTVSNAQAQWYKTFGLPPTATAPPIASLETLLSLPEKPRSSRVVVGISGRLERTKGIDLLLNLISLNDNRRLHFLFAGQGELQKKVEEAARIFENVRYFGRYDHPRDFLSECDIVTVPSRLDTFGISALEAKAAGRPIIVANTCGLVEQADNCGVVVERNCSLSLLKGILGLVDNRKSKELGRNARSSAEKHNASSLSIWSQQLHQGRASCQ